MSEKRSWWTTPGAAEGEGKGSESYAALLLGEPWPYTLTGRCRVAITNSRVSPALPTSLWRLACSSLKQICVQLRAPIRLIYFRINYRGGGTKFKLEGRADRDRELYIRRHKIHSKYRNGGYSIRSSTRLPNLSIQQRPAHLHWGSDAPHRKVRGFRRP